MEGHSLIVLYQNRKNGAIMDCHKNIQCKSGNMPDGLPRILSALLDGKGRIMKANTTEGGYKMRIGFLRTLFLSRPEEQAVDAQYEPYREELSMAGLDEEKLRQMDPDDRVAVLEQAKLDPYDYIYLAC